MYLEPKHIADRYKQIQRIIYENKPSSAFHTVEGIGVNIDRASSDIVPEGRPLWQGLNILA